MKYVHEKVFKFTCDLCNKVLHSKGSLKGHISTVHEGAKPYKVSLIFWNCKKGLCTSRPYLTFILGTVSQKSQCMHQIYCTGVFLLCQNGPEYKYAQRMILGPTILLWYCFTTMPFVFQAPNRLKLAPLNEAYYLNVSLNTCTLNPYIIKSNFRPPLLLVLTYIKRNESHLKALWANWSQE